MLAPLEAITFEDVLAVVLTRPNCNHMMFICLVIHEPQHEISHNMVYATSKSSDQHAHTRCLIRVFASRLNIL